MRAVCILSTLVLAGLAQLTAQGQQTAATNSLVAATNTISLGDIGANKLPEHSTLELSLNPKNTNTLDYAISKTSNLQLSGPLVKPLKAKSASDFGHRVLSLFNPFSKEAPNVPPAPSGPLSTRAWSTIVGYSPGRSAFPDGAWHEPPHLDLMSVRVEKQQP